MSEALAITWDGKYEIGVPRIDFEHRIFADLINELGSKIRGGKDHLSITRTLRELMKYADFHFLSEENIMEDCGYPGLKEHQQLHRDLQRQLNERAVALASGDDTPADLLAFLIDWFLDHTGREDRRIALFCGAS